MIISCLCCMNSNMIHAVLTWLIEPWFYEPLLTLFWVKCSIWNLNAILLLDFIASSFEFPFWYCNVFFSHFSFNKIRSIVSMYISSPPWNTSLTILAATTKLAGIAYFFFITTHSVDLQSTLFNVYNNVLVFPLISLNLLGTLSNYTRCFLHRVLSLL